MFSRPENRIPNPMAILPMVRALLKRLLPVMMIMMPMISAIGAREEGWKIRSQDPFSAFISRSRMICPVTVVPTFAPMIIPSDWCRVKRPAPTRPEVITIVAVDDWMIAVTARPSRKALKTLFVTDSMICLSVPDELSLSPSPISRIPYRNMARPPASVNTLKKSMIVSIISYIGHYSEINGTIYTLCFRNEKNQLLTYRNFCQ